MKNSNPILSRRCSNYFRRPAGVPYKYQFWAPNKPFQQDPLVHKKPEEWSNTMDTRAGVEWYRRSKRMGTYRRWPFARWTDDYLYQHRPPESSLGAFSVRAEQELRGSLSFEKPQRLSKEFLQLVGENYNLSNNAPPQALYTCIQKYVCKNWSSADIKMFLLGLECNWKTLESIVQNQGNIRKWAVQVNSVPLSFCEIVFTVSQDILKQNQRKNTRAILQSNGILRDGQMKQYYALPYSNGPAMPQALEQTSGEYPVGKYLLEMDAPFHPSFRGSSSDSPRRKFYAQ